MRRYLLLLITALLCSVTMVVAQTHTNYITATGENGYTLSAAITAPADDTQQLYDDPVPEGWTISGTINIPGGDFINFTEANIGGLAFEYSGPDFSHPGIFADLNLFYFEATSDLDNVYSADGTFFFTLAFATGSWESNFFENQKNSKDEKKYSNVASKNLVDELVFSNTPAAPPSVPLSPWVIVVSILLLVSPVLFRLRKKVTD